MLPKLELTGHTI